MVRDGIGKHPARWRAVALAPAIVLLLILSGVPIVLSVTPVYGPAERMVLGATVAPALTAPQVAPLLVPPAPPTTTNCTLSIGGNGYAGITYGASGPGCTLTGHQLVISVNNSINAPIAGQNLMIALYNYLNITNSEVANLNATMQELLSYYESRAEAIVPSFTARNWTPQVYDQIAIDSGLVPSLEGLELAFADQQYQVWNATATGFNWAFVGGLTPFAGVLSITCATCPGFTPTFPSGQSLGVSPPFEWWELRTTPGGTHLPNATYFNMMPGGTIVEADYQDYNTLGIFGNYTVRDLTQNTSFYVPWVSYANWLAGNVPIESTLHHVHQFDLLELIQNAGGTGTYAPVSGMVETTGAYEFQNISTFPHFPNYPDTGLANVFTYKMAMSSVGSGQAPWFFPFGGQEICFTGMHACDVPKVLTGGNSTALGTGPGAVQGGNRSLLRYAGTAQALVNNTMKMAYDYWLTLRAITDKGRYAIPGNCAIPTPSAAFPVATNFATYNMSANNIEIVYLSYLNAVAREYGHVFTSSTGFCGSKDLGFSFNWSGSWNVSLNVTASIYLDNGVTPVFLNGSPDAHEHYAAPATWPVYSISPTLLYPSEYQMDVPLAKIYPVPINDPLEAVLVNYTGNLYYNNTAWTPDWGVPTYTTLQGNGNYTDISGHLSTIRSGAPVANGSAILITSCKLHGVQQNPCDLSVTYFNNFTIGLVHAILPPKHLPPAVVGISVASGEAACGTAGFNSWYDAWFSEIVGGTAAVFMEIGSAGSHIPFIGAGWDAFWTALGCLFGWIVVIILLVLVALAVLWIIRQVRKNA